MKLLFLKSLSNHPNKQKKNQTNQITLILQLIITYRVEPPGSAKDHGPCKSDNDCIETETCYKGHCQNPCEIAAICAPTAKCNAKMHRPFCFCPKGHEGNPSIKCTQMEPRKILTLLTNIFFLTFVCFF